MRLHLGYRGTGASLGLIVAAMLWAVNTQLGEALPYPACRQHVPLAGLSSVAAIVASVTAGWWSWRSYQLLRERPGRPDSDARRGVRFLGGLGAGAALIFAVALVLQAVAGFILTGCER